MIRAAASNPGRIARTSLIRLPGRSATTCRAGSSPSRARNSRAGLRRSGRVKERVPDPLDRDARALVDLFLEREDDEHAIGNPLHRLHPPRPPGPQLRTDVVDDGNAELAQRVREAEIEIGIVDGDEHIGLQRRRVGDHPAVDAVRARQHARDFQEAGHRQPFEVRHQARARAPELLAAEAGDHGRGIDLEDLAREGAGVHVAGRLAAGDHDAHGCRTDVTQAS